MRLIGDVHGKSRQYLQLLIGVSESIQLGDMGFDYDHLQCLDPTAHRFIPGNHENYPHLMSGDVPHALMDFGMYKGMFFIRGAHSIDYKWRTPGYDWFPEEEISNKTMQACISLYWQSKPTVVITHECPWDVASLLCPPQWPRYDSKTQKFMQQLWELHQPERWYFGHHHKSFRQKMEKTNFQCLAELEYTDID